MRTKQRPRHGIANLRHEAVDLQTELVKDDASRQRVAVGVQSSRRQPNQSISGFDVVPVNQPLAIDGPDDEPGEIVFAWLIETRHLSGLAADERTSVLGACAPHSADHLLGDVWIQPSGG